MFGLRALVGGTLAIDIAVVAKSPGAVVEQDLTADPALRRHKKYRASINLVIARRDRNRSRVLPFDYIFFVHEQAKREKGRDHNNCVEGAMANARADICWVGKATHCAKVGRVQLKVCSPKQPPLTTLADLALASPGHFM
jgi:hypothetical protein